MVLLDYQMPKMNGFEILDCINNNRFETNIPVIMVPANYDKKIYDLEKGLVMYKTAFSRQLFSILLLFVGFTISAFSQEKIKNNSMILISAQDSSFQMGSEQGNVDEQPVHAVSFSYDFWMDTTEVTQGDYDNMMSNSYAGYSQPLWGNPYGVGDNYPAYAIEWGDAALFCNARSKQAGLDTVYSYTAISGRPGDGCFLEGLAMNFNASGYRLPTEAEWEYACRAGAHSDFFWGKNFDPYPVTEADTAEINGYAVWAGNSWNFSAEDSRFGTYSVASNKPNAFGLYDMSGNVSEWINDWYYDYSGEQQIDPTGSETETYHFVRGGNWGNEATFLRSANRQFASPDYYIWFCGFRTVLPVKATGVESKTEETQPGISIEFALEQNYPNPFNASTTVQFSLPKTTMVTLTVYNALGEKVVTLIKNQTYNNGTHSFHFNAAGLSSGIYFYRLETNDFIQIKKMIVLQ
ncbi:MAG: SUMF1/EgtB/PvdO family nonheme iron enzyme [bacterium]|nr:MAG: SUMF1/EgtB/PvdO family nonheme iron enzyme [bacterium]